MLCRATATERIISASQIGRLLSTGAAHIELSKWLEMAGRVRSDMQAFWARWLTARLHGCCPPSLCVAVISRELGNGRFTSEIYTERRPHTRPTAVPRGVRPCDWNSPLPPKPVQQLALSHRGCQSSSQRMVHINGKISVHICGPLRTPAKQVLDS